MSDDILMEIYNSLVDDEISKILIKLINQNRLETEDDFIDLLEDCLDSIKEVG